MKSILTLLALILLGSGCYYTDSTPFTLEKALSETIKGKFDAIIIDSDRITFVGSPNFKGHYMYPTVAPEPIIKKVRDAIAAAKSRGHEIEVTDRKK